MTFTHGGEFAAALIGLGLFIKYGSQGLAKLRRPRAQRVDLDAQRPPVDAAKTTATLLRALEQERAENRRLHKRINELDVEVDGLRDQIFDQRREYEQEISELRDQLGAASRQLAAVTDQLDALQARIHLAGGTP